MANSYDPARDVLSFSAATHRAIAPARSAYTAAVNPDADLSVYGRLRIFNPGLGSATVTVLPVAADDDAHTVVLTVPAGVTVEPIIARRISAADPGVEITVLT